MDKKSQIKFKSKTYRNFEMNGISVIGTDSFKERSIDYIFSEIPSSFLRNKNILDLGCAAGAICFESIKRGAKLATGVESDKNKIKTARKIKNYFKTSKVEFINTNAIDFLLKNKIKYDVIFVLNILHHIHDPQLFLNLILELQPETIVIESPVLPFFNSYSQFKGNKKLFRLPWTSMKISNYINSFGYHRYSKKVNNFNFIGGKRDIIIFSKVRSINFNRKKVKTIKRQSSSVLIGPSGSGKTFHTKKENYLSKNSNAGIFKLDTFVRSMYSNYLRDNSSKKLFKSKYSKKNNVYYVNPLYKIKKYNNSLRGRRYSINDWIKLGFKKTEHIYYLDVPRELLFKRLLTRAEIKFKGFIKKNKLKQIFNIVLDHNISEKEAQFKIEVILNNNILKKEIIDFLKLSLYPTITCSKSEVFKMQKNYDNLKILE